EQVGDVGDDQVNAEHMRLGEHQAAIDDDDIIAVLENGHVQADLPQPAEGDDLQAGMFSNFGCHTFSKYSEFRIWSPGGFHSGSWLLDSFFSMLHLCPGLDQLVDLC